MSSIKIILSAALLTAYTAQYGYAQYGSLRPVKDSVPGAYDFLTYIPFRLYACGGRYVIIRTYINCLCACAATQTDTGAKDDNRFLFA